MKTLPAFRLAALGLATALWLGCSDRAPEALTGPELSVQRGQDVAAAIVAQERHNPQLLKIPGVVGTAVGLLPNGHAAVRIFLAGPGASGLPGTLDGVPVLAQITGRIDAFSDPTTRQRPAPPGFSVGHPDITAGTIGARVRDASGNVYLLSNNHVLANSNNASIGDATLQPGPYDGGTYPADQIGTLYAFQPIDFSLSGSNTIDAAIARSDTLNLGNSTPTDDGYGTPSAKIFDDANNDGVFDNRSDLLNLAVQKYGRTTKLTHGEITGINATVEVCYEVLFGICIESAYFVDQLIVEPGSFSGGGDSGSLIVTDDSSRSPVALLFAGSATQTIANRIDLVLNRFGVTVDGASPGPPPPPTTDIAITNVSVTPGVFQGELVPVQVTVRNVGNQDVATAFNVTLKDTTDNVAVGTQSVAGLAAGDSATLTFTWNTTGSSLGSHTLIARHTLTDDNGGNDVGTAVVSVNPAIINMHVGDLDGTASNVGTTWSAQVEITVHDQNHNPLNGATVTGTWSRSGVNSNACTTGDLGGSGTCIVLFPGLKRGVKSVTFTVTGVALSGASYVSTSNHDPDGDSNGTWITVRKP